MSEELVIRTMKDDIAEANATPTPVVPSASAPKSKAKQQPVFSLPSKSVSIHESKKQLNSPKRGTHHILIGVSYIVLFFILVAGAIFGYIQWGAAPTLEQVGIENVSLSRVIPKEALAVVDYNFTGEGNRDAVKQIWGKYTERRNVDGNPASLTDISDLEHVTYVAIAGEDNPFLLLKKTDQTQQYVSQQSEVKVIEKNGWYILSSSSLDMYQTALGDGVLSEDSPLLGSQDNVNYLVRYAMSPTFTSQVFNTIGSTAIGFSRLDGMVFYILGAETDGTIRASAHIAGPSQIEGVAPSTQELIYLIPSDMTFTRVGTNLFKEIESIQEENPSLLDTAVLSQPAVRQFISLFSTPYAIFERLGTDGVRDVGIIVELPTSLKKQAKTGDPIIEQSLSALVPLIMGKVLGIQIAFNDGTYNGIPLRYANISGQTQALDYIVGDNFLLFSSSREGMSALLDASVSGKQEVLTNEVWKPLLNSIGSILENRPFVLGAISDNTFASLFPWSNVDDKIPVIISSNTTSTGIDIQVVLPAQ